MDVMEIELALKLSACDEEFYFGLNQLVDVLLCAGAGGLFYTCFGRVKSYSADASSSTRCWYGLLDVYCYILPL